MKEFIKKIWCGQVAPIEDWMVDNAEIKEIEKLRTRHIETLTKVLSEEGAETLEKLLDCDNQIEWIHNEEAFICGVRFAVHFLVEAI